jgi:putative intracellular protease/amidase
MIIGIPVYDGVDMLDVTGPYEMFGWAKLDVELVARKPGLVSFRNGFAFKVTKGFKDAPAYDVLWVPGGDPDALAEQMGDPRRTFLDFLIRQSRTARFVASVCEGALPLAAAGLLDGYEATTHWAFTPCLAERFPKDEALKLIELLQGRKAARSVQQVTQYYPKPPVTSEIPPATSCPVRTVTIPPAHAATRKRPSRVRG